MNSSRAAIHAHNRIHIKRTFVYQTRKTEHAQCNMDSNTTKRFKRGLGASAYGQAIVVLIQLAGVPILVHFWGAERYGQWLVLTAIPAYLSITNLGFSQAVANEMTAKMARGQHREAASLLNGLTWLLLVIVAIAFTLLCTFGYLSNHYGWFAPKGIGQMDVSWIIVILGAEVLLQLMDGINDAGFRSNGQYARYTIIFFTTLLSQNIALWLAASMSHDLMFAALAWAGIRFLFFPLTTFIMYATNPSHRIKNDLRNIRFATRLRKPAVANIMMPIAQVISFQGLTILLGTMLGGAAVAAFTAMRLLSRFTTRIGVMISHTAESEQARAHGVSDRALLAKLFNVAQSLSLWSAFTGGIILLFFGHWFFTHWTNNELTFNAATFDMLLLTTLPGSVWYGSLHVLKACNEHVEAAMLYILFSAVSLVLAYALIATTQQVWGAALALLISDSTFSIIIFRKTAQYFKIGACELFISSVRISTLRTMIART